MKLRPGKGFSVFLKLTLTVVSLWYLYFAVYNRPDFSQTVTALTNQISVKSWGAIMSSVILLMIFNWSLETAKWHMLMRTVHPISWLKAASGVLNGITISMFTPNRSGEFAGRALHADPGFRVQAALASIVGSMNQLLITILAGGVGLLITLKYMQELSPLQTFLTMLATIFLMFISLYLYFHLPGITRLSQRIKQSEKIKMYMAVFGLYSSADLLRITLFSVSRYILFTCQFLLLLDWFGVQLSVSDGVRLVSVVYLVMTFIPSFAVSELTVRGSVALYFIGPYTNDPALVIAATTILWFVNLVIPALPGAFSFLLMRWQNNIKK